MVRSKRTYDPEFKRLALELMETNKSVKEIAEELGVGTSLLYYWRKRSNESGKQAFEPSKPNHEASEIARLKKELREVEIERDILKKAVSIFSKTDGKNTNS